MCRQCRVPTFSPFGCWRGERTLGRRTRLSRTGLTSHLAERCASSPAVSGRRHRPLGISRGVATSISKADGCVGKATLVELLLGHTQPICENSMSNRFGSGYEHMRQNVDWEASYGRPHFGRKDCDEHASCSVNNDLWSTLGCSRLLFVDSPHRTCALGSRASEES